MSKLWNTMQMPSMSKYTNREKLNYRRVMLYASRLKDNPLYYKNGFTFMWYSVQTT